MIARSPAIAPPGKQVERYVSAALAWALLAACAAPMAHAQTARLLHNIDTTNAGSGPQPRLAVGDLLYFTATAAPYGEEVFATDGTAAGTVLLADVNPGAGSSDPEEFVELDGVVFFVAEDSTHGRELWRTDGTPAGTFRLTEIGPGLEDSARPAGLRAFPGLGLVLFFSTADEVADRRLWRSDGSASGTYQLKEVSTVGDFAVLNGLVYFGGDNGLSGREPWVTDGTTAGTTLLRNINPDGSSSPVFLWDEVGGRLFFTAWDAVNGQELWSTDGTPAGTRLVRDIYPGASGSNVREGLGEIDGRLLFAAYHPETGRELWISDGTESGTYLLRDISPGGDGTCCLDPMAGAGGELFFVVSFDGGVFGSELWKTDGTTEGTRIVKDIVPGPEGSWPQGLTPFEGELAFQAEDASELRQLWLTDGTETGTHPVWPTTNGAFGWILGVVSGRMIFSGSDPADGTELWGSDGTEAGTTQIKDIHHGTESSYPDSLVAAGGVGYFPARDGVHGEELWRTDGTEAGTTLVTDLHQGDSSSYPLYFRDAGDHAYFFAGSDLWTTDGTEAGTRLVMAANSSLDMAAAVDGRLFFQRRDESGGLELWVVSESSPPALVKRFPPEPEGTYRRLSDLTGVGGLGVFLLDWHELWRTDGTEAGTFPLATVLPPESTAPLPGLPEPPPRPAIVPFGEQAVVVANGAGLSVSDLWLTDGTAAGTRRFATLPGEACKSALCSATLRGQLYFVFDDTWGSGDYGAELWKTNGTAAGTGLAVDLVPGPESSYAGVVKRAGERLFLTASTADAGRELWVSDGTAAGTHIAEDIYPGATGSRPEYLTELDGSVLFRANHPDLGFELWRSDGTAAGTELVRDIRVGPDGSSQIGYLANVGGLVLFHADDGTGRELWRTDGTEAGTYLVQDLEPGPFGSLPRHFTLVGGDKVVFAATVQPEGREPWVLDDWHVTHELELEVLGEGGGHVVTTPAGIDCSASCSALFDHGQTVTLEAVPDPGSQFAGWSGHPDCGDGRVRMGGRRSCRAAFEPCAAAAEVHIEAVTITDDQLVEACRLVHVGPGVVVGSGGRLRIRAPEGIDFHAIVEIRAGGELAAEVGPVGL